MRRVLSVLSLLLLLFGCAVAPVQEMSDARQAIQAAREAGAAIRSPQVLEEAERLLDAAERSLEVGDYSRARELAVAAHRKAIEARERAGYGDESAPPDTL
ncbi:MAG TPA: DUF4398 domain-containing protein [Thiotrichales bacterium]|nr:DUF4398 domain-containing protein [Thiotrichales bacterium]